MRRVKPDLGPVVYVPAALGLVAVLVGLLGKGMPALQATWQGFGMRAITLALLLMTIMILRPVGIMGRREFTWAWLFRERLDEPTEEERAQDAWLSNPALSGRADAAREDDEVDA